MFEVLSYNATSGEVTYEVITNTFADSENIVAIMNQTSTVSALNNALSGATVVSVTPTGTKATFDIEIETTGTNQSIDDLNNTIEENFGTEEDEYEIETLISN